ncbi:MAG: hypothetical protein ACRCUS_01275 [Anaerovoracaceae bacterium]
MPKRVTVTNESKSGMNETFHDNFTGVNMTRLQFASEIEKGKYPNYYVKVVNGEKIPVSKPDSSKNNNLG